MNIVGLDLSLTGTGIARADGSLTTIRPKTKGMERISQIRREILRTLDFLGSRRTDLVVLEGYAFAKASGAHQLGELGGVIRLMLWEQSCPWVEVAPMRLKKWATGRGNADKDAVLIKAVRTFDPPPASNDEADAAWLRDMALAHYSGRDVTKEKAELLRQVDWPALAAAQPPSLLAST